MNKRLIVIALLALVLSLSLSLTSCQRSKPVRLYHGSWESIWFVNHVVAYLIEHGYQYPVEFYAYNEYEFREGFYNDELDLALELWQVNFIDLFEKSVASGEMVWLGDIYGSGPQFWIIPQWVADKYNIRTVYDMKDHWAQFKNPRNPHKGAFYNCIIGWDCLEINAMKMEAYGLDKYYEVINPGTAEMLETTLENAQKANRPVFGYYWSPTPLMGKYDWYILEEPPFSEECWTAVGKALREGGDLSNGCAYRDYPVRKVAHKNFVKRAPELVELIRKVEMDLDAVTHMLAWAKSSNQRDWNQTAIHYLKNNREAWKDWVSPEAYERIATSLDGEQE